MTGKALIGDTFLTASAYKAVFVIIFPTILNANSLHNALKI